MASHSYTVSLFELVDAIASCVELLPEAVQDIKAAVESPTRISPYSHEPSSVGMSLLEGHLHHLHRTLHAAKGLHYFLHEAVPTPDMPAWRHWGKTGTPLTLHTADEKARALGVLERKVTDIDQTIDEYFNGRLKYAYFDNLSGRRTLHPDPDAEWRKHLGFMRGDIVPFLDAHGIPHNLQDAVLEQRILSSDQEESEPDPVRYLSSPVIAKVFHEVVWTEEQWANKLKSASGWLRDARRSQGQPGRAPATWDPMAIAVALHRGEVKKKVGSATEHKKVSLSRLNMVFKRHHELEVFREAWSAYSQSQESYEQ